ncbi:MAG: hypothetical protein ACW98K_07750 [Candidatus Kariarchaeaceae archaeon]|jgi:hypothetical protein
MSVLTQKNSIRNDFITLLNNNPHEEFLSELEILELKRVGTQLNKALIEYELLERVIEVRYRLIQHIDSSYIQVVQYENILEVMWLLKHNEILNGFRIIGPSFTKYPSNALIQDIASAYIQ